MSNEKSDSKFSIALILSRGAICFVILAAGFGALIGLSKLKKPPTEKQYKEEELKIRVVKATKIPVKISFTEYGTATPVRKVVISSEVNGRIISLKDDLKTGSCVTKGETILKIDSSDYKTALALAKAKVDSTAADIKRIKLSYENDKKRLVVLEKDHNISLKNLERIRGLFKKNVQSQSELDRSEQEAAQKENAYLVLKTSVALYPSQLKALKAQLRSGEASINQAKYDISRCTLSAPFTGRVVSEDLELDQYVRVATPMLTIADDSSIEIPVSVYGGDLLKLGIKQGTKPESRHWVEGFEKIKADICWSESESSKVIPGKINRIARYDDNTRTAVLVVRPDKSEKSLNFPLVAGMFCKVILYSDISKELVAVPRSVVQFEGRVFTVDSESRLKERKISIFHRTEDMLYIDSGINDGEMVVSSKLPFELVEGMKVKVIENKE